MHKVPALVRPEPAPVKPSQSPPTANLRQTAADWLKKTAPIVLPSVPAQPAPPTPIAEAKPALKPPVLPKRALLKEAETQSLPPAVPPPLVVKAKDTTKKPEPPATPAKPPETVPPLSEKEKTATRAIPIPPSAPLIPPLSAKAPEKESVSPSATAKIEPPATTPKAPAKTTSISPLSVKLPERDKSAAAAATGKLNAAPAVVGATPPPKAPGVSTAKTPLPKTRAERARKRRLVEILIFWVGILPLTMVGLVLGSFYFGRETRVEGQVIPPHGMSLSNEVWIVNDFSSLASGIAEDLAAERTPLMQEIQERQEHVQRASADVASREERLRLIQEQISSAKDEIAAIVKKSRDETQALWDGEGAEIDNEYQSHMDQLKQAIAARAKSLNLKYAPDENFQSPEVWANAYRLALYEVPPGVDTVKEHEWLGDQMKQWRDLQKSLDDRKEKLREEAAQKKLEPAPQIADLNAKIDDLQQRNDSTVSEEIPLKEELQQAQADLALAQAADANLDDKYYKQLYSLPEGSIVNHRRFPVATTGRFTWVEDEPFVEGEPVHHYWIFSRATRSDGRQYWAFHHFSISKNQTVELIFEPGGFESTKAILRPNLSPEEQEE